MSFELAKYPGPAWKKTPAGEFLAVSDRYIEVVGFNPVGKNQRDVFPPELAQDLAAADARALEHGESISTREMCGAIWQAHEWRDQNGVGPVVMGIAVRLAAVPKP